MVDRSGQAIGNYRLSKLLGHGGFADVYLGEHIYLKTFAAIKVLHTQLANDDIERFRIEAQTIAHLIHPHIIRVLDFDVDQYTPLLVMDYAPDGTLGHRHPKGTRLPLATVVSYVKQIASALQYAHDRRLIHRDVKPENMLIGPNGELLLSDFGIALIAETSLSQSTEDTIMGTMAYMAPEQLQGKTRPASDQYALAVVVYEWLCGARPFTGSYMEVVTQHLSAAPPPMHNYVVVPPEIERVIFKALDKDPHERFARVQDFADALEQAYQNSLRLTPPLADTIYATPHPSGKGAYVQQPGFSGNTTPISQASAPMPGFSGNATPVNQVPPTPMPGFSGNAIPANRATPPPVQMAAASNLVTPLREYGAPRVKKHARSVVKWSFRVLAFTIILVSLLLCGLGFGAFRLYNTFTSSNAGPGTAAAVAEANNFLQALSHQSYAQAYNDFDPALAKQVSSGTFLAQGQLFDRCDGKITQYTQDSNPQIQNGTEKYSFTLTRTKLAQAYRLYLTVHKGANGTWQVSDYTSDLQTPSC
ncbi:MAG: serine/threonine protein kinase [Ktedonobacteraceae bacterium]|nr:serine/threonine protein kinase [Ktedonobacteraceae bacterium]